MTASLRPSLALLTPLCLLACGSDPAAPGEAPNDAPVWYPEVQTIVVQRCGGCHTDGGDAFTSCLDGQLGADGACAVPLAACGVEVAP